MEFTQDGKWPGVWADLAIVFTDLDQIPQIPGHSAL
jgi:hypothetical protein